MLYIYRHHLSSCHKSSGTFTSVCTILGRAVQAFRQCFMKLDFPICLNTMDSTIGVLQCLLNGQKAQDPYFCSNLCVSLKTITASLMVLEEFGASPTPLFFVPPLSMLYLMLSCCHVLIGALDGVGFGRYSMYRQLKRHSAFCITSIMCESSLAADQSTGDIQRYRPWRRHTPYLNSPSFLLQNKASDNISVAQVSDGLMCCPFQAPYQEAQENF